jgi:hypothetical protein
MQVMGFICLQVDPHIAATFVWLNASPIDTLLTSPRRHLDSLLTPLHLIAVEGAVIIEAVAILPSPLSSRCRPSGGCVVVAATLVVIIEAVVALLLLSSSSFPSAPSSSSSLRV